MPPEKPDALKSAVVTVPNLLSLFRILLVPFFLRAILTRRPSEALLIFVLASLTDLLDGFTARVWHQKSKLGTVLDPAGDKLLMTASFVVLTIPSLGTPNYIPLWLTAVVFARDLLIVTGALYAFLSWGQKTFTPSLLGKASTACQVGAVFLVLWLNHLRVTADYMPWVFGLTLLATVASGVHYFVSGLSILRGHRRGKAAG
jgi:cardiolipin synthase (CMP-forming)